MNKNKEPKEKNKKKKMTAIERNRLYMKIATWFLVLIMLLGVLITLFSPILFG